MAAWLRIPRGPRILRTTPPLSCLSGLSLVEDQPHTPVGTTLLLPFTEQFVVCTHVTRIGPFVVGYVWLTLIFLFAQMYSLLEICFDCRRRKCAGWSGDSAEQYVYIS